VKTIVLLEDNDERVVVVQGAISRLGENIEIELWGGAASDCRMRFIFLHARLRTQN
jgi:pyruvate carboxylase